MKNNYSIAQRNAIVEANLWCIDNVIRQNRPLMRAARLEYDDVYQQLALRLIKAVAGYDPEKGRLEQHIFAQLKYELLSCRSAYRLCGTAVCSFSIAVDRDFKSKNGEKETDFIDIVSWRATAEFVSKYFTKGRMAVVEGRLQIRDWTDKEGGKRRSAEVIADNVYFGDSKPKDGGEEDDVPAYTGAPDSFAVPDGFTPDFGGESGEMPF